MRLMQTGGTGIRRVFHHVKRVKPRERRLHPCARRHVYGRELDDAVSDVLYGL